MVCRFLFPFSEEAPASYNDVSIIQLIQTTERSESSEYLPMNNLEAMESERSPMFNPEFTGLYRNYQKSH